MSDDKQNDDKQGDDATPVDEGTQAWPNWADMLASSEQPEGADLSRLKAMAERDQFESMAKRAQADLINYRRRVADERQELRLNANADLIMKFLSVVDDFDRAISMLPKDAADAGWQEGLILVQRNLANILESEGVSKIAAEGMPFDPREHEAVHYQETPAAPEGTIINVFRDGYRLHDRVMRASQVIVAKAPPAPQDDPDGTNTPPS